MAPNEQADGRGDLAARIRRRRGALGLTREEVAARARMDSRAWSDADDEGGVRS